MQQALDSPYQEGRFNRYQLRLGDLSALDAAGANPDPLGCAVHERLDSLQIHVPAATRHVVRVRDVIAKLRPFAANIAYLCHDFTPISFRFCRDRLSTSATSIALSRGLYAGAIIGDLEDTRPRRLAECLVYRNGDFAPSATLFQYKMSLKDGFDSNTR
jgi:hypothetical protein